MPPEWQRLREFPTSVAGSGSEHDPGVPAGRWADLQWDRAIGSGVAGGTGGLLGAGAALVGVGTLGVIALNGLGSAATGAGVQAAENYAEGIPNDESAVQSVAGATLVNGGLGTAAAGVAAGGAALRTARQKGAYESLPLWLKVAFATRVIRPDPKSKPPYEALALLANLVGVSIANSGPIVSPASAAEGKPRVLR